MQNAVTARVEGINKSFGATKAVVDMHLSLQAGEIHGLIGENGSGKSTLASMLAGVYLPDSGNMWINGKKHAPKSMLEGRANGVCMLLQEKGTINGLTVAQNIFLGKEDEARTFGFINRKKMECLAGEVLKDVGIEHIDPSALIDTISFEDRKLVEIAMVMKEKPQILILDETTTALSQNGRDLIYRIIRKMREEGKTIVFISHDLDEMQELCDNITVMRDGQYIVTLSGEQISPDAMRHAMIGRDLDGKYYRTDFDEPVSTEPVLEVRNITLENTLKDVSFDLHRGEILGIGGLTDCGMHELCKVIFGLITPQSGTVYLPTKNVYIHSAITAAKNGMGYVPKDRELEGLMPAASVQDNISIMSYDKIKKGPFITKRSEKRLADTQVERLRIKISSLGQSVANLSGGNKQKVVLAKSNANDVDILILDCPTRGIDVGVKASIYRMMEEFKTQGKAMIMVSEELSELIGMSDNIIVLKNGVVTDRLPRQNRITERDMISRMI